METVKTRSMARKVACFDVVATTASIFYISYGLINLATVIDELNRNGNNPPKWECSNTKRLITTTWIHDTVIGLFLLINICVSFKLFKNTKPESDVDGALRTALIWRNVNVVFAVVCWTFAVYIFTLNEYLGLIAASPICFRGVVVACALRLIKELRTASSQDPTDV